eukprot:1553993-Prorocentrum_lima.AAC.2
MPSRVKQKMLRRTALRWIYRRRCRILQDRRNAAADDAVYYWGCFIAEAVDHHATKQEMKELPILMELMRPEQENPNTQENAEAGLPSSSTTLPTIQID